MTATAKRIPQPKMVERKCDWCKCAFQARAVDVARGWAKFCTKSCKAKRQENSTGQYRALAASSGVGKSQWERDEDDHLAALDGMSDAEYGASDGGDGMPQT